MRTNVIQAASLASLRQPDLVSRLRGLTENPDQISIAMSGGSAVAIILSPIVYERMRAAEFAKTAKDQAVTTDELLTEAVLAN